MYVLQIDVGGWHLCIIWTELFPLRYNFEEEDFQAALQVFNEIEEFLFEEKGLVNVWMRICTRYFDYENRKETLM